MAEKVSAPRAVVAFAERKWREIISHIVTASRQSVYSLTDQVIALDGSIQTVFSKSFKTAFFQSAGDALDVYMSGQLNIVAAGAATFYVSIFGDTGSIDSSNFMVFPFTGGGGGGVTADFIAKGRIFLSSEKDFKGSSRIHSESLSNGLNLVRLPGATFNEKEMGFSLKVVGDVGSTLTIDLFQVELIPAVIN